MRTRAPGREEMLRRDALGLPVDTRSTTSEATPLLPSTDGSVTSILSTNFISWSRLWNKKRRERGHVVNDRKIEGTDRATFPTISFHEYGGSCSVMGQITGGAARIASASLAHLCRTSVWRHKSTRCSVFEVLVR